MNVPLDAPQSEVEVIDARRLAPTLTDVVIVSDSARIDGGGAAVALGSAVALARAGVRVTVVSAVGPPMQSLLDEPNVRVLCSEQRHAGEDGGAASLARGIWNTRAARLLDSALSACPASSTVVHVHGWTKALSSSVARAAFDRKFPVVLTLHDYFAVCPNGSLYQHPDRRICTLEPMGARCILTNCDSRNYGVKLYRVVRQIVQNVAGGIPDRIRLFVTVSSFSHAIMKPYLPADARFTPIVNPTDFEWEPRANPEANATFLFLGRLSPEKGGELLAEAARRADVDVSFAGDGPTGPAIRNANPDAHMLGWLDRAQARERLRSARALVMPSLWYETYGLAVMEAAALGIPAIVPNSSAARDLVSDGETGLWFEGGDVESLAGALRRASLPGVADRMGAAAFERFWQNPPTMAKHVSALLGAYASVLDDAA